MLHCPENRRTEFSRTTGIDIGWRFRCHGALCLPSLPYPRSEATKRYFEQHGRGAVADPKGVIKLSMVVF
jgi:hypothetical protein